MHVIPAPGGKRGGDRQPPQAHPGTRAARLVTYTIAVNDRDPITNKVERREGPTLDSLFRPPHKQQGKHVPVLTQEQTQSHTSQTQEKLKIVYLSHL